MQRSDTYTKQKSVACNRHFVVLALVALVCVFLMAGFLSGCRYTDVLDELILDQYAEVDPNLPAMRTEKTDADEDNQINSVKSEDADHQNDEVNTSPQYGTESNGETAQRDHNDDSTHNENASSGDQVDTEQSGDAQEGTTSNNDSSIDSNTPGSGTQETDQISQQGEAVAGGTTEGEINDSGLGGTGKTYDGGTYEDLPSASHIAAVGSYAVIVQMLGGKGALSATDEETLDAWKSSGAFENELDAVSVGWSGDGKSSADGTSAALIDAIRDSAAECVLVSESSATFTPEEIEQLQAPREGRDGIDVVQMPNIGVVDAYDSDITLSVRIVGEVLKNAGSAIQFPAQDMANEYVSLHDQALSWASDNNGGLSIYSNGYSGQRAWQYFGTQIFSGDTAILHASSKLFVTSYIDQWASAKYPEHVEARGTTTETVDISSGTGVYAKASGVSDNVYLTLDYYLQHAGVMDTLMSTQAYAFNQSAEELDSADFIMPYTAYRIGYNQLDYYLSESMGHVKAGSATYPGIITRTSEQADLVRQSMNSENGTYNIGTNYDVFVLPASSVSGSWADGTVESFLVAPWAFCVFQDGGDLSNCTTYAQYFYETFYRCSVQAALGDTYTEG